VQNTQEKLKDNSFTKGNENLPNYAEEFPAQKNASADSGFFTDNLINKNVFPMLPDTSYFIKVLRRQWIPVLAASTVTFLIGLSFLITSDNVYKSSSLLWADKGDGLLVRERNPEGDRADSMIASFQARFDSPNFLVQLYEIIEENELKRPTPNGLRGQIIGIQNFIFGKKDPKALKTQDEIQEIVSDLKKRMTFLVEKRSGIMELEATGPSPFEAQFFTSKAMELFVQQELNAEVERLKLRKGLLLAELTQAKGRLKQFKTKNFKSDLEMRSQLGSTGLRAPELGSQDENTLRLRQREAELQDKIEQLESDSNKLSSERAETKIKLETEYKTLLAKFQPNHPDVVAKKEEIYRSEMAPEDNPEVSNRLRSLRRELWEVRAKAMGSSRTSVGNVVSEDLKSEEGLVISLTNRIKDMELDQSLVERQISQPETRTRLRIIKPATFEATPKSANKKKFAFGVIFLTGMVGFGVAFLRELRSPIARDAWRVVRATQKPILAQIARKNINLYSRITPTLADELRASLGAGDLGSFSRTQALLSFRRLELAIQRSKKGRVVLFANSGPQDELGNFFFSLFNLYCTDNMGKNIVVDCNPFDPIMPNLSEKQGLADFLKAAPDAQKIVVLKHHETAFDLIPPTMHMSGEKTRVFQKFLLEKFFEKLLERYDNVFVRALPESHFIENCALLESATDCFVCVDAKNTKNEDLERTLVNLNSDKIRGLVMLGT
jgi:uncharacterized protein involved in exopolysaccharide biosynthesis